MKLTMRERYLAEMMGWMTVPEETRWKQNENGKFGEYVTREEYKRPARRIKKMIKRRLESDSLPEAKEIQKNWRERDNPFEVFKAVNSLDVKYPKKRELIEFAKHLNAIEGLSEQEIKKLLVAEKL